MKNLLKVSSGFLGWIILDKCLRGKGNIEQASDQGQEGRLKRRPGDRGIDRTRMNTDRYGLGSHASGERKYETGKR